MTHILLDRTTNVLVEWPRDDGEPVVGLDRAKYHILQIVRSPAPTGFDPATHATQPLAPVVSITDPSPNAETNGTATYGWELIELPPAPGPETDWSAFRQAIFTENGYVDAHALALKSDNNLIRFAATALFDTLRAFENTGNYAEYLQALLLTVSALLPIQQAALVDEFIGLAQRCHLSETFIAAFQQATIPSSNLE